MAITFVSKRNDVGSTSNTYTFLAVTMATTDTITLSGLKEVWDVTLTNRPNTTYVLTSTGAGAGTAVLTLVATASSTGTGQVASTSSGPCNLVVYGR